jgi:hypothetical protein
MSGERLLPRKRQSISGYHRSPEMLYPFVFSALSAAEASTLRLETL